MTAKDARKLTTDWENSHSDAQYNWIITHIRLSASKGNNFVIVSEHIYSKVRNLLTSSGFEIVMISTTTGAHYKITW